MDYRVLVAATLEENRQVLEAVNPQEIETFLEEILRARTLHLYGMGRMQLSVRAFAMRLKHMGFDPTSSLTRRARELAPETCSSGIVR
jgi:6-phospho-3-hexuloisomerase